MTKIEKVNKLHEQAMEYAEKAFFQKRKKEITAAENSFKLAFDLEKNAAMELVGDFDVEPTRSVLFKGAANLAFNAKLFREAERMIGFALTGNPPEDIAQELRNLIGLIKIQTTENSPIKTYESLPENLQKEVADFIDFLANKYNVAA